MKAISSAILAGLLISLLSALLSAQPQRVRVINNRSAIMASDLVSPITYVDAGAELILVGEQGGWLEVVLPGLNPRRETGFIARVNIAGPLGTPVPRTAPLTSEPAPNSPERPRTTTPSNERGSATSGLARGWRGFGQVSVGMFTSSKSFDAVLGSAPILGHFRGPWIGAGAQYQARSGLFVEGSVDFFRDTGQRVFVSGDTVFDLGIRDTLTLVPVSATVGYRGKGRTAAPFVGGGIGQYLFSERTPFDESSERAWQKATSYHALGGVEFRVARTIGVAVQGRYTTTPNALNKGVGSAFGESNLGGLQFGVKLLIAR